ncbi:SigB/SigF/SigG family RNA polymerase sigma factor [Actinomadura montaniterrae]|uniref:SigB/SigF/SigG family RNA polymerase sigma factor n=1 Tax=Actinomadura montaniterrae TaxID=1803903 RepID=A0A6L3VYA0_9ACTN|nr:SigB/SigF/SigG family RNA polymerase sigma factor [Actinomadura montaniterrae]KAB2380383.1 SigB/SigF/SigG family RNA polymerase sigma factor [Actinomadura montaniterrae]
MRRLRLRQEVIGLSSPATSAAAPPRAGADPAGQSAEALLSEMNLPGVSGARREELRAALVRMHAPMVRRIAHRYAHRGEPVEDLAQVAYLGLVNAINRFDPERGDQFFVYAYPMVLGEVRRYFRDRTWGIRVSRRIQELRPRLQRATQRFLQAHGRSPTPGELAAILGVSLEEVTDTLLAWESYRPLSLDGAGDGDPEGSPLAERLGAEDAALQHVVDGETLHGLLARLPERERTIVLLRFFGNRTQSQIAQELGISQMHVSRLLSKTLTHLREQMYGP